MKTKYDCSNSRKQNCKIVNNMSEKIYSNCFNSHNFMSTTYYEIIIIN